MTRDDGPDDELMTRLSAVLHDEARGYEPAADSLVRIQHRTSAARSRTAWRWAAPLAAAAVVVGVASAVVFLQDGDQTAGQLPASSLTPTPSSSPPSANPSPSVTASSSELPGCVGAVQVPVYYVGADSASAAGSLRLYREFHLSSTCGTSDAMSQALTAMLTQPPVDPDYASAWPSDTRVRSVQVSGNTATVDLTRFTNAGALGEQRAVDQLVWTATAADPSVTQVRLLVNGSVPPSGHSDWSQPQRRGSSLDTLANVWILTPTQGAKVGSPVSVSVYGTGFEGNVPIKVFRDGTEVASTQVTTAMGGFAQATTTLDLPAGSYEIRAYNDNGKDSSLELWDTKTFTVA